MIRTSKQDTKFGPWFRAILHELNLVETVGSMVIHVSLNPQPFWRRLLFDPPLINMDPVGCIVERPTLNEAGNLTGCFRVVSNTPDGQLAKLAAAVRDRFGLPTEVHVRESFEIIEGEGRSKSKSATAA